MTNSCTLFDRIRRRLAGEGGFTMIVALGVLMVTSLLLTATFVALDGQTHLSQADLEGKRAYYAAQAGLNAYLYHLNQDSTWWQTCSNNTTSGWVNVPGNNTGEQYQYNAEPANNNAACSNSNVVNTMIDTNSGGLSMTFWGKSGNPAVTRGIVATFKRASPIQYLWYTVYEAFDTSMGSQYSGCNKWYRQGRSSGCEINWVTGDHVNGPMYTQDQLYVQSGQAPVFGRSSSDTIATLASNSLCDSGCGSAVFKGTQQTGISVPEPSDNSGLLTDAQNYGVVFSGVTTISLSGNQATAVNCPTSSTCSTTVIDLTQDPIIYVQNASGCSPGSYSPFSVSYTSYGCNGDVYISGSYTSSLTVGAANNIMVAGDLTTTGSGSTLTGNAVLGLVANEFVRVEHTCSSPLVTLNNVTIDAAILALDHSFIVDNYNCGSSVGNLTVNGAIVQKFRGAVGTSGSPNTGYLKAYTYDDRLKYLSPPYLFDILDASWNITRENQCAVGTTGSQAC
jgi:Tfp pilus assembly protein PilX